MARAVLRGALQWTAPFLLAVAFLVPARAADQTVCSSKNMDREIQTVQEQMTGGPFYKELLLRFGKPITCNLDVHDGVINLTYGFRHGARLIARTDPKIEFSEQSVQLIRMDKSTAVALLKRAELDAYQPTGCGISWTNGEETPSTGSAGTREVVYRGDTCNCQARLIYKGDSVVMLVLRSAC